MLLMLSMPPATTTLLSPAAVGCQADTNSTLTWELAGYHACLLAVGHAGVPTCKPL
jgi:hypothetical protein